MSRCSCLPEFLKASKGGAHYKKGDSDNPSSYRFIAVLPAPIKIFEHSMGVGEDACFPAGINLRGFRRRLIHHDDIRCSSAQYSAGEAWVLWRVGEGSPNVLYPWEERVRALLYRDVPQKVSVLSPLFSLFANNGINGFLDGSSQLFTNDSTLLGWRNTCFCRHLIKVSGRWVDSNRLRLNQDKAQRLLFTFSHTSPSKDSKMKTPKVCLGHKADLGWPRYAALQASIQGAVSLEETQETRDRRLLWVPGDGLSESFLRQHQVRNISLGTCCCQWTSFPVTEESHKAYFRSSTTRLLPHFVQTIGADDRLQPVQS